MNIGFYTPNYPGFNGEGGIGTYTRDLAKTLAARGHQVHILTPGHFPEGSRDGTVAIHPVRADHFRGIDKILPGFGASYRIGVAMMNLAHRHRLDITEFANWEGKGLWFAASKPTPLVVRLSTSSLEAQIIDGTPSNRAARWEVRRERWLARASDALVTHSRSHRHQMSEELNIKPERILVAPLGVQTFPTFVKAHHHLDHLRVVYLGRLEKRKGTLDLLHAIPEVLKVVPAVRFNLIGSDRPHCPGGRTHGRYVEEELAAEVRSQIEFLGPLGDAEVHRQLQTADLFVSPSHYESFGLTFLEAMRWGTPVVGTVAGGIPEIIEDGVSGRLVAPGQPLELAKAITDLLQNPELRQRLGESGRRRVETQFSLDHMAARTEEIYGDLLHNGR